MSLPTRTEEVEYWESEGLDSHTATGSLWWLLSGPLGTVEQQIQCVMESSVCSVDNKAERPKPTIRKTSSQFLACGPINAFKRLSSTFRLTVKLCSLAPISSNGPLCFPLSFTLFSVNIQDSVQGSFFGNLLWLLSLITFFSFLLSHSSSTLSLRG